MAEPENRDCGVCGKGFVPQPNKAGKYCGIACYRVAQRAGAYKPGPVRKLQHAVHGD